jgi:D-beta-D-heptose 7-phosphate kinase / D-beta-D-heptose 1-phosphate adenosyltransferase
LDLVILFQEKTPLKLIKLIKPDFLVKESDYNRETLIGHEIFDNCGGKTIMIELEKGKSTTEIMTQIEKRVSGQSDVDIK